MGERQPRLRALTADPQWDAAAESTATSPVIEGKIRVPGGADETVVERPRLAPAWWAARSRPLTLIVAPAGYGKTTAATQLVAWRGGAVAWVTLDPWDNDPARFTDYVVGALRRATGAAASGGAAASAPEAVVDAIRAAVETTGEPLTLVLDDLHLITSDVVLGAIDLLVSFPPDGFDLVVTSRTVPKLPLARWRLHGSVHDVGVNALRFTLEETRELVDRAGGGEAGEAEVARLYARTEGWPAALRLEAARFAGAGGEEARPSRERALTGEASLLDFLEEEVLDRLPAAELAFLVRTSPLDRLSDELCRAVVGPDAATPSLRELSRRGILISALDDAGEWYRYHALMSAALRRRLAETLPPAELAEIHRRASDWFSARGDPESAIDHALQARDWPRATAMIQPMLERMAARNRIDRLHDWLQTLPHAEVRESAEFSYWVAWTLVREGLADEAEPHIARAEQLWRAEGNDAMLAAALNVRATMAFYRGHGNECVRLAREAEQRLPAELAVERQTAHLNLGLGASMSGRATEAARILEELLAEQGLPPSLRLTAGVQLGWVEMMRGRLDRARTHLERACTEDGNLRLDVVRRAHVWLADIALEQDREDEAETLLRRAERLAEEVGSRLLIADTGRRRARIALRRGDPAAALALLERRAPGDDPGEPTPVAARQQAMRVACWTQLGRDEEVRRWVAELELAAIGHLRFGTQDQYLAYARWLVARGRHAPAHAIAERLCRLAQADGRTGHLVAFLVLRA